MPDLFGEDAQQQKILAIVPTQRDANRATIRVGTVGQGQEPKKGRGVATLTSRLIADLGLYVGQAWSEALAARVAGGVGFDQAMRAALSRLSRRSMSGWMLSDKLKQLGHAGDVVDAVLDRLGALELLDDERFGRALVRDTLARKPAGPALLKQKLYHKGIRGPLADRLVAEATADEDAQRAGAADFARKRAGTMANLDAATRDRRLYGQLARRGFGPDTIRSAIDALGDGD